MANGPWERGAHTSDISWFEQSLWSGLDPWSHIQAVMLGLLTGFINMVIQFPGSNVSMLTGTNPHGSRPSQAFLKGLSWAQYCFLYLFNGLPSVLKSFCSTFADDTTALNTRLVKMWRLRALIYQRTLTQPLAGPGPGECYLRHHYRARS